MAIEQGWDGRVPNMRGKRVRYIPNNRSFGAFILSDQVRDPTEEVARDIADLAKEFTPRRKDRGRTPDGTALADRFTVDRDAGAIKVDRAFRVMVKVHNDADHAAAVEFGSKRNRGHRMLGKAGSEFGDFKPDGGLTK